MEKEKIKTIILARRLQGLKCSFLRGRNCLEIGTPCCFYCPRIEECYENFKRTGKKSCPLKKGTYFCWKVANLLLKVERGEKI